MFNFGMLLFILFVLVVLGVIRFYLNRSPILDQDSKNLVTWILLGAGIIVVIWYLYKLLNPHMSNL